MLKTDEWMAPRAHIANGQRHAPQRHTPLSVRIHTYTIQVQQCFFSGYSNTPNSYAVVEYPGMHMIFMSTIKIKM